jgi:hypothetical protein
MSELTKKERQAIIDRWLNDEEDDEYEVVPMKTRKGKFIVRHRSSIRANLQTEHKTEPKVERTVHSENEDENEDTNEKSQAQSQVQNEKSQKYINDLRSTRIKDSQTKSKNKRNELGVLPEILEHLKVLGDDIKRRQQKKDIKHEIKHIHLKDKVQNTVIPPTYETQIDILPRYVRPKLNLEALCSRYH